MGVKLYTKVGTMPGLQVEWWGSVLPVPGVRRRIRWDGRWVWVHVDRVEDLGDHYLIFCSLI